MKFDGFDLDLTKITKGYGVNPLDAACAETIGDSSGGGFPSGSVNFGGSNSCVATRCETDCDCPSEGCPSQGFTCTCFFCK